MIELTPTQLHELDTACAKLSEHFGAVLILASIGDEPLQTAMYTRSRGNYYACKGMAHGWIEMMTHQDAAREIGQAMGGDDE